MHTKNKNQLWFNNNNCKSSVTIIIGNKRLSFGGLWKELKWEDLGEVGGRKGMRGK